MSASASELRARAIFDLSGGAEMFWPPKIGAWTRAVEWFENRASVGGSPGERLLWCMTRCKARDFTVWSELDDDERGLLECMATMLVEYGCARPTPQPTQHPSNL